MKNENVWKSFMDSLTEEYLSRELDDFIKYLGFEDFEKSDIKCFFEALSTEVYGFDDRRIYLSVIDNKDSITGRYVITDKNVNVLDIITFKLENDVWIEVEDV